MADFNKWQAETLAPGWLQGPLGVGLSLALGHIKDSFAQTARQAVKARFPLLCPADALPSIAADRLLDRTGEDEPTHRARLVDAWDLWSAGGTKTGIEDAVNITGLCTAQVYDTHTVDLGPGSWARYVIELFDHPWSSDGLWNDPGTWDDQGTWDSTATPEEVDLIRRQVARWSGAHADCLWIIVPFGDAELWDMPLPVGTWDAPGGIWGDGIAAYWPLLPEGNDCMSWIDNVFKWLGHGQYNSTPPEFAESEVGPLQQDINGNLKVAVVSGSITAGEEADASVAQVTDLAFGGIIKASAGKLVELVGFNNSDDDRYLILCNSATVPADATATTSATYKVFVVPGGAPFSYSPPRPLVFGTGISWVCSSTRATVTRATDFYAIAQYL